MKITHTIINQRLSCCDKTLVVIARVNRELTHKAYPLTWRSLKHTGEERLVNAYLQSFTALIGEHNMQEVGEVQIEWELVGDKLEVEVSDAD